MALMGEARSAAQEGDGTACIWGAAWHDDDDGATRTAGEPGASGVTVDLLDDTAAVIDTASTGPAGDYRFTGLVAGTYRLRFSPPGAASLVAAGVGADATVDSDPDPTTGLTAPLALADGEIAPSIDAGLDDGAGDPMAGIGDFVWADDDGDGLQGPCEPGVANVDVDLLDDLDAVVATETTDSQGHYFFTDPGTGDHRVRLTPPVDTTPTVADAGDDTLDSDIDPIDATTDTIAYVSGDHTVDIDAGLVWVESPTTTTPPASSTTTPPATSSSAPATDPPTDPPTTIPPPSSVLSATTLPLGYTGCDDDEFEDPSTGLCLPIPPSTTTPVAEFDREKLLAEFAAGLGAGALSLDDEVCDQGETSDANDFEYRCAGLMIGEEVHLVVTVSRASEPSDGETPTSPSTTIDGDAPGTVAIRAGFETQVRLTVDPERVEVDTIDGTKLDEDEAAVVVRVLPGSSAAAVFVITPLQVGEHTARLDLIARGAGPDESLPVAGGKLTFSVEGAARSGIEVVDLTADDGRADGSDLTPLVGLLGAVVLAAVAGGFLWYRRGATAVAGVSRGSTPPTTTAPVAAAPLAATRTPRVFVSYSRADTARVTGLIAAIEEAGIETWIDKESIADFENWKAEIVQGLRESDGVVLVLSETSVDSDNVAAEVSIGKSQKKPLLPVHLHDGITLSDQLTYDLADIQYVKMFDDRGETIDRVVEALRRRLDAE